jgi:hypothetical protein
MHGRLLLEVNENCAHIFKVDVRRVKNDLFIFFGCAFLGSGRRGAKIIPIVPSFLERGLAGLDFVLSNTDYDLICGILKRKRNRRIYLDHNIEFFVNQERSGDLNFLRANVLDEQDRLISFYCLDLHQDTTLPKTGDFWIFVHIINILTAVSQWSTIDIFPKECAILMPNNILSVKVKRAYYIVC